MTGLHFDLTCPTCGRDVELVTNGRVILGREASAIVRCSKDGEWQVNVRAIPFKRKTVLPPTPKTGCGTDHGYFGHRRRFEAPCDECKAAHSAAERVRTARQREEVKV